MKLLSSIIFMFFGYIMLFFNGYTISNMVIYLLSLIIFSVKVVFPEKKAIDIVSILFLLVVFIDIKTIAFIPIVIYSYKNIEEYKGKFLAYIILVVLLYYIGEKQITETTYILCVMMIIVAAIMNYSFQKIDSMTTKLRKMRDDRVEYEKLLKEKNKTLIENQDYAVYTATLKERNRIAREIHDNIGHSLSRSILMVGAMKAVVKDEPLAEPINVLDDTLKNAMTEVRNSVHDLHDDSFNLRNEIAKLKAEFEFCEIKLNYDANYELPNVIKYNFITVIKEALVNVSKHSNADEVKIIVREHPSMYQLIIQDDGSNIDVKKIKNIDLLEGNEGIGIKNMKERIQGIGGNFIVSAENGFKIHIVVPK